MAEVEQTWMLLAIFSKTDSKAVPEKYQRSLKKRRRPWMAEVEQTWMLLAIFSKIFGISPHEIPNK
jgi:hypothetical protein